MVNDLGGSRAGEGANSKMADLVVHEIIKKGKLYKLIRN